MNVIRMTVNIVVIIVRDLGSKDHDSYGFWDLIPE